METTIKEPKNKEEFESIIKEGKPTLVEFFATWCGPCQMMGMVLDEMATKYPRMDQVNIIKIDIDELGDLAKEYDVLSVPTIKIFYDGKETESMSGMRSEEDLIAKLNSLLDNQK